MSRRTYVIGFVFWAVLVGAVIGVLAAVEALADGEDAEPPNATDGPAGEPASSETPLTARERQHRGTAYARLLGR
jgi:hypothetical protein